jgi:hypothetical protein
LKAELALGLKPVVWPVEAKALSVAAPSDEGTAVDEAPPRVDEAPPTRDDEPKVDEDEVEVDEKVGPGRLMFTARRRRTLK